ncbi:MAG: sugar nucleotide-binding protein [Nanoarchaeota archaeon]
MKVAIIGADGFLGTKAAEILSKNNEVVKAGKNSSENKLDVLNISEVRKFLLKYKPEVILDTVALTSSTKCENNPRLAEDLNYKTAKNISEVANEIGAWMVFMSSSYLFDGKTGNYNEDDKTSPINEYARTKIMAEKEILKNPKGIILRVDIMYGYNGKDKKNGVFDTVLSGNFIELREPHQLRQPIFVDDVPRLMMELVKRNKKGIFHLAGPDKMEIIELLGNLESIVRENSLIKINKSQPVAIKIPENATLNTAKMNGLGIKFTTFEKGLSVIKKRLIEN